MGQFLTVSLCFLVVYWVAYWLGFQKGVNKTAESMAGFVHHLSAQGIKKEEIMRAVQTWRQTHGRDIRE